MKLFGKRQAQVKGRLQYSPGENIFKELCDLVFIDDGEMLITIQNSLEEKLQKDLDYFKCFNLTSRELEIVEMRLRGNSNIDVSDKLCISKSTLKKHLNNIYQKIPDRKIKIWST